MNRRTKMIGGAAGVVAVLVATVLVLWDPAGEAAVERSDGVGSMEGMDGMQEMDAAEGMDMGGMSADGSIRIDADDLQTFGITFGTVDDRPLTKTVRAVGLVEFDETRMTYVAPKFGGWAERLHVDFVGRPVREGEPLLEVYAPELVTAQEELLIASQMLEDVGDSPVQGVTTGAQSLLASARRRLEYWDVSPEQIDRLLETGEVRKSLTLHAPASGIVMEKNVVEGQAFQAGTSLYMIAGLSEVWVNAEVFESDAAFVREGLTAEITVAALPGRTFTGRIEYVYPTLEERTRSLRARIALANPGRVLKPGMYATVRIASDLGQALTLPASAVLHTGERAVAFVDMGGGRLMPHELRLGARGGDLVQVLSGVEAGDRVVTSAQFLLDSESNLAEVMQAMMIQMGSSEMDGMDMEEMGEDEEMPGMDMEGEPGMDMDTMDAGAGDTVRPDTTGGR